jgi:DNA-binding NarL/FixJ family response regulator
VDVVPAGAELGRRAVTALRVAADGEARTVPRRPPIHLAVVDPNRVCSEVIAARLGSEEDIQVLRCVEGVADLRQLVGQAALDVVLADAGLFDPSMIPERQRCSRPAFVLRAEHRDRATLAPAVRAGVRGWVPRSAPVDQLLAAVRAAAGDGTWLPPTTLTQLHGDLLWPSVPEDPTRVLLAALTPREREVLTCLAEGLTRPEVATRLRMSTNTVRTHVQSTLSKLGVNSSLAAVALLRSAGPPAGPRAR